MLFWLKSLKEKVSGQLSDKCLQGFINLIYRHAVGLVYLVLVAMYITFFAG